MTSSAADTKLGASVALGAVSSLSVLADPSFKGDLSQPAIVLASALDQGLGEAFGLGKSLSAAGLDVAANLVGEIASVSSSAAEIVSETIQAVPILGQLASLVFKVMSLGLASTTTPAQHCEAWQRLYVATPTGSVLNASGGHPYVPADHFARTVDASGSKVAREEEAEAIRDTGFPVYSGIIAPSDRRFRSLMGMALMIVTEGTAIDERDLSEKDWSTRGPPDWNATNPPYAMGLINLRKPILDETHVRAEGAPYFVDYTNLLVVVDGAAKRMDFTRNSEALRSIYRRHVDDYYEALARSWHRGTEDWGAEDSAKHDRHRGKRGLPRTWRVRFRGLRRGIESMHMKRDGDGGSGLWILYMDLLASAFKRGYLSRDFIRWNMIVDGNLPCVDGLADAITRMATNWSNTITPNYVQGKAKLEALDVGSKGATTPVSGKGTPASGKGSNKGTQPPASGKGSNKGTQPPATGGRESQEQGGHGLAIVGLAGLAAVVGMLVGRPPLPPGGMA